MGLNCSSNSLDSQEESSLNMEEFNVNTIIALPNRGVKPYAMDICQMKAQLYE